MQARRRRDRHLRRHARVRLDEFEMLEHRMAAEVPSLPVTRSIIGFGLSALELDLALAEIGFDAVELAEEIVIPEGAAEFAIGDGGRPDVFLPLDDAVRFRGLRPLSVVPAGSRRARAWRALLSAARCATGCRHGRRGRGRGRCMLIPSFPDRCERGSPAPRGPTAFAFAATASTNHPHRSLAHCSSSASTLPSSVEAKPHCGDRQSWSSGDELRRLVDAALDLIARFQNARFSR